MPFNEAWCKQEYYHYDVVLVKLWKGLFSNTFHIKSGVRQGGIWSSWIFNLFVDVLIDVLEAKDLSCVFKDLLAGCICYADDILLLSGSISKVQQM